MRPLSTPAAALTTILALPLCTQAQLFTGFGSPSYGIGVSADGSVVLGYRYLPGGTLQGFRWTLLTAIVPLTLDPAHPGTLADSVSAHGEVVVGTVNGTGFNVAARWPVFGAPAALGYLPNGSFSYAADVSRDGSVIVGGSDQGTTAPSHAFRWTAAGGMQDIGSLPGLIESFATGVSDNGSVIVGTCDTTLPASNRAFRWTQSGGMVDLGELPGSLETQAFDLSADGAIVVGRSADIAFRWTVAGMVPLALPFPGSFSSALAITGDGSIIAGYASYGQQDHATFWDGTGYHDLNAMLAGLLPSGWLLTRITGISDDGRTFVGEGLHNGLTEGWVAVIHAPCYANCDGSTAAPILNVNDFVCFNNRYAAGSPLANCDGSTIAPILNVNDFTCYLNKYAMGCP